MFVSVLTGALRGVKSYMVTTEVDISPGLPVMELIGCLSKEAGEAKERIHVALKNNGICLPTGRITVNLSPASEHKSGTGFDLPIALGLLAAMEKINSECLKDTLFVGELGLNGEIKPVRGILPIIQMALDHGITRCVVPKENATEAAVIDKVKVYSINHLREAMNGLNNSFESCGIYPEKTVWGNQIFDFRDDFSDISGQQSVKRAAEIAVAGFHHMMIIGSPGSGKTMVARRLPTIMPPLTFEESKEVSSVYSVSGKLSNGRLLEQRPFMAPHHTCTASGLIGGGRFPKPGAVSMSHHGILFLDEFTEFNRSVLDMLRQPMEDRIVEIARNYDTITYPANFLLVGAMNPCPCGYYPNTQKCRCSPTQVKKYLNKISGPLIDRMDICIEANEMPVSELIRSQRNESSESIRHRVLAAREMQQARFKARTELYFNGQMNASDIKKYCPLDSASKDLLSASFEAFGISARSYGKVLKTARTIADLAGSDAIKEEHIQEAIFFKVTAKKYWE